MSDEERNELNDMFDRIEKEMKLWHRRKLKQQENWMRNYKPTKLR